MAHSPTRPPPLDPEPLPVDACSGTDVARLGASTDRNSLLVHAERDAMPDPDQEAYILRLPVEVLTMIVELAVSGSRKPFHDYYGVDQGCSECVSACNEANAKAVCLVSRTWRDIIQPMLFRVIDLGLSEASSRIWQTLSKNAHLRKHCRKLSIVYESTSSDEDFAKWKDVLCWSINARCMQISTEMIRLDLGWSLVKDLATHAHQLRHLVLSGVYWYPNLMRLVDYVEFPRLAKLNAEYELGHDCGPTSLPQHKQRMSPATSLTIRDNSYSPRNTLNTITWPKALEHFTFQRGSRLVGFPTILLALSKSLSIHEKTLKSVDISHVVRVSHLFDARLFPNLEYLRLSRWHLEGPLIFTPEYTKILGPQLKILKWNFNDVPRTREYLELDDFKVEEELWLRELAAAAAGSKLQLLWIEFTPKNDYELIMDLCDEGFQYPWDRMDRVRDTVMQQIGISLKYDKPSVSRNVWSMHEYPFEVEDILSAYEMEEQEEAAYEADRGSESEVESEVESIAESEREPRDEEEVEEDESEHD